MDIEGRYPGRAAMHAVSDSSAQPPFKLAGFEADMVTDLCHDLFASLNTLVTVIGQGDSVSATCSRDVSNTERYLVMSYQLARSSDVRN